MKPRLADTTLLSPAEIEAQRRETPRPRPRAGVTDLDLADAIERAWNSSRFREPTVVAGVELAKLRRGGAR